MRAQVTVTPNEAKRLIAKAVAALLGDVRRRGKILLKGGTTVSAVAEELCGIKLRISGRVTKKGTKSARTASEWPHSVLITGNEWRRVDADLLEVVPTLTRDDAAVISGNIMDSSGRVAMMAGAPLGGEPGKVIGGLMAQGVPILIPMTLDKLGPASIADAVRAAGRSGVEMSLGMPVGLIPLEGRVITEVDAVEILSDGKAKATVIGRGGILGAEGSTTMVIVGPSDPVGQIFSLILSLKGGAGALSGEESSLAECVAGCEKCRTHRGCIYGYPTQEYEEARERFKSRSRQ